MSSPQDATAPACVEWVAQEPARAYVVCSIPGCRTPLPIAVSVRVRASGGLKDLAATATGINPQAVWDHMLTAHGPALA